jgi:hypothetical protein
MPNENMSETGVTYVNEVHIQGHELTFVLWASFNEFHKIRFETKEIRRMV